MRPRLAHSVAELRRRRANDTTALVGLLRDAGYPSSVTTATEETTAAWLHAHPATESWVAVISGQLAGHVALGDAGRDSSLPAWRAAVPAQPLLVVQRLFVAPVHRKAGVGAALLDRAVSAAVEQGAVPVLDVLDRDRAAVALYRRHGFVEVPTAERGVTAMVRARRRPC